MSDRPDALAARKAAALKAADAATKEIERARANPFAVLPAEWIGPTAYFFSCKMHLFISPLSICNNLRYWIARGLQLDDAKAIFRRLCDPEVTARHRKDSDLVADMAGLVDAAIKRRRADREVQLRRQAATEPDGGPSIVTRLADHFKAPKE